MTNYPLDVKSDRITLTSILAPRYGYELEAGVGCTFTLDFETVLGVFYSLGMKDEIPEKISHDSKLQILHGIEKYSDKLSIYCNECAISVPKSQNRLHGLMDKFIFEVVPPKGGIFHPKVWILLYKPTTNNESAPYIKLIVSSRNISQSSNLDYAVAMEAIVQNEASDQSKEHAKPLIDLLEYLKPFTPASERKTDNIKTLKEALAHSKPFTLDKDKHLFDNYQFLPLGIFEEYNKSKIELTSCKKEWLVVVSPFLKDSFIDELFENAVNPAKATLLTRKSSLTENIFNRFNKNVYGLRSLPIVSDESENALFRDVHAKMYIYRSGGRNVFLTGSANATDNAFKKNVEFMLQLEMKENVSYESICEQMFQLKNGCLADSSPFEKIEPPSTDEQDQTDSDPDDNAHIIFDRREICEMILGAEVQPDGDQYTVVIKTNGSVKEGIKIAPLNAKDSVVPLTHETRITGLSLNQLSNFYIITTSDDKFVKIIETKGITHFERNRAIVNTIIESETDFYKMIELILANYPTNVVFHWETAAASMHGSSGESSYIPQNIYERALQVAVNNNKTFEEIQNIISLLPEEKVNKKLKDMLDKFNQALSKIEKTNKNPAIYLS